jgi:hypothetical protein
MALKLNIYTVLGSWVTRWLSAEALYRLSGIESGGEV